MLLSVGWSAGTAFRGIIREALNAKWVLAAERHPGTSVANFVISATGRLMAAIGFSEETEENKNAGK
jgi:hypothetical protein